MFYKFSNMTQNLNAASQDVAMGKPINPQAFSSVLPESPKTYYEFKPVAAGPSDAASARQASTHSVSKLGPGRYAVPNSPTYRKLMDLQTRFTAPDGKLVWQKLPKDMPLYYLAIGLVTAGTIMSAWTLKQMCTPPKN